MEFDDEKEAGDLVSPIKAAMDMGDHDTARKLLAEVPDEWREAVRWTIATMTQTLL